MLYFNIINQLNVYWEKIFGHGFLILNIGKVLKNLKNIIMKDKKQDNLTILQYREVLNKILSFDPVTKNSIPSININWDNTPRYRNRSSFK